MIPGVHIYIDGLIKDGDKIVRKIRKQKGHSFVLQFPQFLLYSMNYAVTTALDTGNVARALNLTKRVDCAANLSTHGLVIGSNATAVTVSDYKLNTIIAHGTGAGQLQYSAVAIGAPSADATSSYFIISRVFTNASGGNVSVNEVAIYTYDGTYYHCMSRDVLASTITLTNGQNLTLNFTIKVVV